MRITDLYIYPVKSLGGIRLTEAQVRERGFAYDRRWMLTDTNGKFLTQRTHREMANVGLRPHTNGFELYHKNASVGTVLLTEPPANADTTIVDVWGDRLEASIVPGVAVQWLQDVLGFACRLVYMGSQSRRQADPLFTAQPTAVSFADSFPYLLTTVASLRRLEAQAGMAFDMRRFRPNIVVDGKEPFEEDRWKVIRMGNVRFQLVKACDRCSVITIDPDTAQKSKEPLRTLSTIRREGNKVLFGVNMVALDEGRVHIDDVVEVLEHSE